MQTRDGVSLEDRPDRSVRWFFDGVRPGTWLQCGALGSGALGALVLLASFHAVVTDAVDRASGRRLEAAGRTGAAVVRTSGRPVELARLGN